MCTYELHATMCRALRLEYDDVDERVVALERTDEGLAATLRVERSGDKRWLVVAASVIACSAAQPANAKDYLDRTHLWRPRADERFAPRDAIVSTWYLRSGASLQRSARAAVADPPAS